MIYVMIITVIGILIYDIRYIIVILKVKNVEANNNDFQFCSGFDDNFYLNFVLLFIR